MDFHIFLIFYVNKFKKEGLNDRANLAQENLFKNPCMEALVGLSM